MQDGRCKENVIHTWLRHTMKPQEGFPAERLLLLLFLVDRLLALQIDYLWAPRHFDLVPALTAYHTKIAGNLSREQLTYITFAGFWEDQATIPNDYLEALDAIRERAKLLIVMGVPLVSPITLYLHLNSLPMMYH